MATDYIQSIKARRQRIFNLTDGRCYYCGCRLDIHDFHIEHVIPQSKGGKNTNGNCVPSCRDCNLMKGTLDLEEFRAKIQNMVHDTTPGRMICKYFDVEETPVVFFFER